MDERRVRMMGFSAQALHCRAEMMEHASYVRPLRLYSDRPSEMSGTSFGGRHGQHAVGAEAGKPWRGLAESIV
jgi:hypothetical protein